MKKKEELKEKVSEIVEKLSDTWQGTKEGFVKFVSDKKNKKMIKKAAITGSVFALSALMTACSMGVEHSDDRTGLYFEFGGKEKSSQTSTVAPSTNGNELENNSGSLIFGGDGQDWDNSTPTGGSGTPTSPSYDNNIAGGSDNDYTSDIGGATSSTTPDDWYDDGMHFGGGEDGGSYDATNSADQTEGTQPTNPDTNYDNMGDDWGNYDSMGSDDNTTDGIGNGYYDNYSGSNMDIVMSKLAGANATVTSVRVELDNGEVAVYDMEKDGAIGKFVQVYIDYECRNEVNTRIVLVPLEIYSGLTGGVSMPELTGEQLNCAFVDGLAEYVAGERGIALPDSYKGM